MLVRPAINDDLMEAPPNYNQIFGSPSQTYMVNLCNQIAHQFGVILLVSFLLDSIFINLYLLLDLEVFGTWQDSG